MAIEPALLETEERALCAASGIEESQPKIETLRDFILAFRSRAAETKGACFYCGRQTTKQAKETAAVFQTKDHVIPMSAIGKDSQGNRVICCRKCNSIKEDLTLFEFKRRSEIEEFYAEKLFGVKIENLLDIDEVTLFVMANRRIEGRCIKFNGKPEIRTLPVTAS